MPLKKILIILIILLIVALGILAIYNFFIKENLESNEESNNTTSEYLDSRIKLISQEPVIGPIIDNEKVRYYLASNGNVFESNFDGSNKTQLSSNNLSGLIKVLWSKNKDKVITIFEKNYLLEKYLYDYNTDSSTLLDYKMRWITWSPTQEKIAYQYYDSQTDDNNISIANSDGSEWDNILSTRMKNLIVEWPDKDKVILRTKPSGLAQSVIYAIDLSNNNLEKIIKETYGLTALWSPLGDKILISETNSQGKNLKLKLADLNEQIIKELTFTTLPEKCVWSQDNKTIFCAVPKNILVSAVLPDDYYKKEISFSDEIWQINLETEDIIKIKDNSDYDAKELLLSPFEDYILFINQKDNLLYSLEL